MIKVCPSSSFYSTPVLISGADLTCILRAKKRSFFKAWFVPIFFLFAIFFCRSSETRPPEDDEEEEEEILGSDDDEQEDPKDYVKGKNNIFCLNFTHYTLQPVERAQKALRNKLWRETILKIIAGKINVALGIIF